MKIIFILVVTALASTDTEQFTRFSTQCNFIPGNTITQIWSYWNTQQCIPCQQWCTCDSYKGCTILSCPVGYTIADQQCIQCPTGCAQCTLGSGVNVRSCQQCSDGYQLVGKMCVELTVFQIKTSQLREQYMIYTNPYSQPLNTNVSVCKKLNSKSSLCQECNEGYFLNEFNQCESCPTGCVCQSRGTCPICLIGYYYSPVENYNNALQDASSSLKSGFYRYGSPTCVACKDPNAVDCSASDSLSCKTGYFLDKTEYICTACTSGCSSCSTTTNCFACLSGYWLSGSTCSLCTGNTNTLQPCQACNSGSCSYCVSPYQLYNGTCINCSQQYVNCISCTDQTCTQCNNGYYLNQGQCTQCGNNVQYCNDDTGVPTQCVQNYLLVKQTGGSNLTCSENINNCMLMIDSGQLCSQCFPEQILFNGKCINCYSSIQGCTQCGVSDNSLICKACQSNSIYQSNYALNVATNTCTLCPTGCLECTTTVCTSCMKGYLLANGGCSSCQLDGCAQCSTDGNCLTCQSGYYLLQYANKYQCFLCPYGCATCYPDGNTCQTCNDGYVLRNNGCTIGTIFCASYTDNGDCQECMYGFALRNGICLSCIDFTSGYVCGENSEPCDSYILALFMLIFLIG